VEDETRSGCFYYCPVLTCGWVFGTFAEVIHHISAHHSVLDNQPLHERVPCAKLSRAIAVLNQDAKEFNWLYAYISSVTPVVATEEVVEVDQVLHAMRMEES